MSTYRHLVVLLSSGLIACGWVTAAPPPALPPPDTSQGLLFHASFDVDRRADVAVGEDLPCRSRYARENRTAEGGTHTPGVFGAALSGRCGKGGSGHYAGLGNVLPERGTIAFFVRQVDMHYGFEPLWLTTVDSYYWGMFLRFCNKNQSLSVWNIDEVYRPDVLHPRGTPRLESGEWTHLALVWDQAYGATFYVNGAPAGSDWGERSWTSRGVDPDGIRLFYNDHVFYDELYVFDFPLSAAQLQTLHGTNTPPAAPAETIFDERRGDNRLQELSWTQPDPAVAQVAINAPASANTIRRILPLDARAVKKYGGGAIDGKLGQGWPPLYNYRFNGGNGLHIHVGQPFDLITIEGYFNGDIHGSHQLTPTDAPWMHVNSPMFKKRLALTTPRPAGWLSLFKQKMEDKGDLPDKELVTRSRVCEVSFFRRSSGPCAGAGRELFHLIPASIAAGRQLLGHELSGRYGRGDRATFAAQPNRPSPGGQRLAPLRFHHLVIPATDSERYLHGIELSWQLRGALPGNLMHVELRDPTLPARRPFSVDLHLTGSGQDGRLNVALDTVDRVIPPGKPLWLVFCFRDPVDIVWDSESISTVTLLTGSRDSVLPEFTTMELGFLKARFRAMSEPRPWGAHEEPEKVLPQFSLLARELFYPLQYLWEINPDDPKVKALWLWTHKFYTDTTPVDPMPVPGAEDAPRWALLQREFLRRYRDVFLWWIEHRQTPNGEFGDAWGDDTDLTQNLPKLFYAGGPTERLSQAARLVADGVYDDGLIERGINRRLMDTLHAYEEGVNVQPVMGLIDYGEPKYIERMMEAVRTVRSELMAPDVKGRLRFRSSWFGAEGIRDQGRFGRDQPGNALFMHPALFLTYYSRNTFALAMLRDWIDGWLDIYSTGIEHEPKRRFPKHTLLDGSVIGWDSKIRGYGYLCCYAGLHEVTGDPRYRSLTPYWTGGKGPGGSFMRGSNYTPALELIDRQKWREQLIAWAREAQTQYPTSDRISGAARERYMLWEVTGDEAAAYEALEAGIRNLRLTYDAYTWGEPINDRIWATDLPLVMMMQGEISHHRNQLWPRHYVSYEGFSDLTAWVRRRSNTALTVWVYSFAQEAEAGAVRVWRTEHGNYRVSFGPDTDGDEEPENPSIQQLELHRSAEVPLVLPPRKLMALTITQTSRGDGDYWQRPDLALARDTIEIAEGAIEAWVHNLGSGIARNVLVQLQDASGKMLEQTTIAALDAPVDCIPRKTRVRFTNVPGAQRIAVDPQRGVPELNQANNVVTLPGRGR
ncbi:MAG: hypothetical protein HN742_00170 [Lentisphaerae bacterium]|nr:hypothetical protein [Lentisphaerota bacterium]MBT5605141.1 hypothetical protein [Lentisphaerota bacterium]MBT7060677.1 hypothetical protein [Lentisphaerota bacterium]MBT7840244.1 hypothetical protein [Lentisphaerota bacterium]